jgi:hypothetical protein
MLNVFVPKAQATWPQSKIVSRVFAKMHRAYAVEAYCGRFDDIPYQTLPTLKDKNFLRLLELSEKLLLYLGEMDRYYRMWLGLVLLLSEEELQRARGDMTFEGFLESVKAQWEIDLQGTFPREFFVAHKPLFQQILLAYYLWNVAS